MDHYGDDDLTDYINDPTGRQRMEGHLSGCGRCRSRVAELERVQDTLRDAVIWGESDGMMDRPPRVLEALSLKRTIERENADAVRMLAPLISSPFRFVESKIVENPKFHTAGVVRMLCAEAAGMHEKRPKFSLRLAEAAVAVAGWLNPQERATTRHCRGQALRERANALRYLGQFHEALKACDEAESFFDTSPAADAYDRAVVGYVRGSVLVQMEREHEGLSVARSILSVFRDYGDEGRELSTLLLEGAALNTLRRQKEAAPVFDDVIALARRVGDQKHLAYALQAAATNDIDLGKLDRADTFYAEALAIYEELGVETESIRIEWALGGVAMARGQLERAERLLEKAARDLQRMGLRNDHAQATLEWAEVRLALNRPDGVAAASREILPQFENEGMLRNARLALAELHQALAKQRATPELVRQVRTYLRDLPKHPHVTFVAHV